MVKLNLIANFGYNSITKVFLNLGRLAMIAIMGMIAQEYLTGIPVISIITQNRIGM